MSKPSQRPNREERKAHKKEVKKAQKALREQQIDSGLLHPSGQATPSNTQCPYQTKDEEQTAREEAVAAQISTYRSMLPKLLRDLSKIPDPRNPKKSKHKLIGMKLYGLLSFLFLLSSRRETNRTMSRPVFKETLAELL
jgi:hypothetical protein